MIFKNEKIFLHFILNFYPYGFRMYFPFNTTLGKDNVITAYMQSGNLKYYVHLSKDYKNNKVYLMLDFTYQFGDGVTKKFVATKDIIERINEAFSK